MAAAASFLDAGMPSSSMCIILLLDPRGVDMNPTRWSCYAARIIVLCIAGSFEWRGACRGDSTSDIPMARPTEVESIHERSLPTNKRFGAFGRSGFGRRRREPRSNAFVARQRSMRMSKPFSACRSWT